MLVGYKSSERYVLKKCSKCNAFNSFRCLYSAENKEQKSSADGNVSKCVYKKSESISVI